MTTIQRVERGGRPSADTIASLAAAFGLQSSDLTNPRPNFDDQPYLPLTVVATGRQLLRLLLSSDSLDFCFAELTDLAQAELVDRLQSWCASHDVGGERLDRGDAASSKRIVAFTRDYEAMEASVGFERLDGVRIRTRSAQASFEGRLPYAAPAMREDAFPLL